MAKETATPETIIDAARMAWNGHTGQEIAEQFNVNQNTVTSWKSRAEWTQAWSVWVEQKAIKVAKEQ